MLNKNVATLLIIQSFIKFLGGLCFIILFSWTHFQPMFHLYTHWIRQKAWGFLTFSKGYGSETLVYGLMRNTARRWNDGEQRTDFESVEIIVRSHLTIQWDERKNDYSVSNGKIKEESKYTLLFLVIFPNSFWKPQMSYGIKRRN